MKIGQIVKVYQKPYSDEDFEGEARLMKPAEGHTDPGFEHWYVCFEDDRKSKGDKAEAYPRLVKVQ